MRSVRPPVHFLRRLASGALRHVVAALLALAPTVVGAQQKVSLMPQLEARLDGVLSPGPGAMAGLGVNVRAGWYARLGLALSAGQIEQFGVRRNRQRLDATARFLFDPFAESKRAFYAGAGLGAELDGSAARPLLLGVVGVEGASAGKVVPAIEVTLGGGVRLGVVLRGRRKQGR